MYNNIILKSSGKVNSKTSMIIIFSHKLIAVQEKDAENSLGVCKFIKIPQIPQDKWSDILPELSNLKEFMIKFENFIKVNVRIGAKAIYAATKRIIQNSIVCIM